LPTKAPKNGSNMLILDAESSVEQDQDGDDEVEQYNVNDGNEKDEHSPVLQQPDGTYQEDDNIQGNQDDESTDMETEQDDEVDCEGQLDDEDY